MEYNWEVGQKVLVTGRHYKWIGTILRITPTGQIKVQHQKNELCILTFDSHGRLKTSDPYDHGHIEPLTPELQQKLHEESFINKTLNKMHEVANLSYAQAIQIMKILDEKQEG